MWAEISQSQSFDEYLSPFAHNNSKFEGVFNEFPLSGRKYFMHNYYRSGVGPHESHPIREYMFRAKGKTASPVNIFLFKVSNRNTRNRCKMCSNLTVKTAEPRQWRRSDLCRSLLTLSIFTPFYNVFIVEFEQVNVWKEVNVSPHFPAFELNIEFIDKLWARKNSEFEYFSHNAVSLTSL